jgi:hypothetical protein
MSLFLAQCALRLRTERTLLKQRKLRIKFSYTYFLIVYVERNTKTDLLSAQPKHKKV